MDDLDRKILALLAKNARMPVKEIAEQVALTSPAVSSRIHKLETDGIIGGYTVTLNRRRQPHGVGPANRRELCGDHGGRVPGHQRGAELHFLRYFP